MSNISLGPLFDHILLSNADKALAFAKVAGARLRMFRRASVASVKGETVISSIISLRFPNFDVASLKHVNAR